MSQEYYDYNWISPPRFGDVEDGTIPEIPTVSCDVRLGDKYASVEFDYDAFQTGLIAPQFSEPRHADSLNIEISAKKRFFGEADYNARTKTVRVVAGKSTNELLAHEIKHATDDQYGTLGIDKRYAIGLSAALVAKVVVLPIAATNTLAASKVIDIAPTVGLIDTVALLGLAGAAYWGYWRHPLEKSARGPKGAKVPEVIKLKS